MKAIFEELLNHIPDYREFLTLAELDDSSRRLAAAYPDSVELFEMGRTVEGRPLLCLKIEAPAAADGSPAPNALMFGCPHPNEPIGTMMLEYLTESLAKSEELRREIGYTWYVVKAWDADGLVRNEGWLKGPYSIRNYGRHFFRPAGYKQVDWTFPIDYKELHFHDTLPETEAMMALIDRIRPEFIYALHNSGFGGVYWYVTRDIPAVYPELQKVPERWGVPMSLGTPESPSCVEVAPATYEALGVRSEYDYIEKYACPEGVSMAAFLAENMNIGDNSASYAGERYGTFTFLTELPYFYDPRTEDTSPSDMTRLEALQAEADARRKDNEDLRRLLTLSEDCLPADDPFLLAVKDFSGEGMGDAELNAVKDDPAFQQMATVTEKLDRTIIARFYKMILYGMLLRAVKNALAAAEAAGESVRIDKLRHALAETQIGFDAITDFLESNLNYSVIPIRNMVGIQLHSGLAMLEHLKGGCAK